MHGGSFASRMSRCIGGRRIISGSAVSVITVADVLLSAESWPCWVTWSAWKAADGTARWSPQYGISSLMLCSAQCSALLRCQAPNATNALCGYHIVTGQPSDHLGEDFKDLHADWLAR